MSRWRRAAWWLGASLVVIGVVLGVVSGIEHGGLREDWLVESERLGAGDSLYDSASSDELYASGLRWRDRAAWSGRVVALGLLLTSLLLPAVGAEDTRLDAEPGRPAHVAALADGGAVTSLLVLAWQIEPWLGPDLAAWGSFLSSSLPGGGLALLWGGLSRGTSLGGRISTTRICGADGRSPGVARGLAALLLFPLGLSWAPLALVVAPKSRPPHLAWVGLRTVPTASRQI